MAGVANAPVIRVAGLSKSYETAAGLFPALRGIDLSIDAGEYLAIMGLLSDRQKSFVALRYEQGFPLADVAERMRVSLRGAKWYSSELYKALTGREIGAASKAA